MSEGRPPFRYDARLAGQIERAGRSAGNAELREAVTPLAGGRDPDTLAEVAWSALHGVATLTRARRLRPDYQQARLTMLVDRLAGGPGS